MFRKDGVPWLRRLGPGDSVVINRDSVLGNGDSVLALMSSVPVPHAFALRACGERAAAFCRKDEGADPGAAGSSGGGG